MTNKIAYLNSSHAKLILFFLSFFISIFWNRSFPIRMNLKWGGKSNNFNNNKKSIRNYNKRNEIIFSLSLRIQSFFAFCHHFYLRQISYWINLSVKWEKCILRKYYIRNIFSEMDQNWYFLKKKQIYLNNCWMGFDFGMHVLCIKYEFCHVHIHKSNPCL